MPGAGAMLLVGGKEKSYNSILNYNTKSSRRNPAFFCVKTYEGYENFGKTRKINIDRENTSKNKERLGKTQTRHKNNKKSEVFF